jgi:hypothetical protein
MFDAIVASFRDMSMGYPAQNKRACLISEVMTGVNLMAYRKKARQGEMGIRPSTRETIAAAVTARRMLAFCAPD